MKICFVLPIFFSKPCGGAKIVFEYANRLVKNNDVCIVFINATSLQRLKLPESVRKASANIITKLEPTWFKLDRRIKKYSLTQKNILRRVKHMDAVIATAVDTVEVVDTQFKDSRKYYLIQDFENWNVSDEYIYDTYRKGITNIVISKWLYNIVYEHVGMSPILISNPIDTEIYRQHIKQEERYNHSIGVLFHKSPHKGFDYSLAAIRELKKTYQDLKVEVFGISKRPDYLDDWVEYTQNASVSETVKIYNAVSVFMCSTLDEGFGLTGLEAMSCGSVLVSTEYEGVKDYAINGYNSLLSPRKDVEAMIKNVTFAFENIELRIRLSENGKKTALERNWAEAAKKLEEVIKT